MILDHERAWGRLQGKLKLTPEQALRMFGFIMDPTAEGVIFRQYVYLDDILRPHTGTFISNYKPPTNPQTDKQQEWRNRMTIAVAHWHRITPEARANWNRKAKEKRLKMSGFNLHNQQLLLHAGD